MNRINDKVALLFSVAMVIGLLPTCNKRVLPSIGANAKTEVAFYKEADISGLVPEVYNMNVEWKFFQPPKDEKQGPLSSALDYMKRGELHFYDVAYDDSEWETVSIPHPFNADDMYQNHASSGGDRGIYQGVTFYRKVFTLPKSAEDKKVFIEFEGIRMAAYVYLNGELLGYYEGGVSPFGFDLSAGNLFFDKPNILAVAADNRGAGNTTGNPPPANNNLRETIPGSNAGANDGSGFQWSSMDFNPVQGGLNRNVKLHVKNSVYQTLPLYRNLRTQGTYVYPSEINVAARTAVINVEADVRNESAADKNIGLAVILVDMNGKIAHQFLCSESQTVPRATDTDKNAEINITAVPADYSLTVEGVDITMRQTAIIKASFKVDNIQLWSPDIPYLYDVYAILKDSDKVIDVVKITTGFRKAEFRGGLDGGVYINDEFVWLTGYAQRSTNEWAAIGTANDWLHDYEMSLVRESNANFIRWMHIAPTPSLIRSTDRSGVVSVVPSGDKENGRVDVRQWNQRLEAMRDVMIYFRNSPSVLFWEAGNAAISTDRMRQMVELRKQLDPSNMRVMGCRSLEEISAAEASEWVGTMLGRRVNTGGNNYTETGRQLIAIRPIIETEYTRDEAPRRVWDRFSPPYFDYRNYFSGNMGATPPNGRDAWDYTQEEFVVANVAAYNEFYSRMINTNSANPMYAAAAALCWSESNQHGRQTATETGRMSGRVDAARIKKPSFYAYQAMQAKTPTVYLVGHWNYPTNDEDYRYFIRNNDFTYSINETALRDAANKTIFVVASNVASVELFVNGVSKGVNNMPTNSFLYRWQGVDITKNGDIYAVGYNAQGEKVAMMRIETTGEPVGLRLTPVTGPEGLRADGSDIACFDVEVVDAQGRISPLSYDRINFSLIGPATIMGGYNSGAHFLSEWVKGYNKTYFYAECGINRLFIKAGREAGDITLKANIDGGRDFSATIKSVPFEVTNGLTKTMPQIIQPDVWSFSTGTKQTLNVRSTSAGQEEAQSTRIVEVMVNGAKLDFGRLKAYNYGTGAFAPALITLEALKASGTSYIYDAATHALAITCRNVTLELKLQESTMIVKQSNTSAEGVILNDMPALIDGVLYIELDAVCRFLGYGANWNGNVFVITTYSARME